MALPSLAEVSDLAEWLGEEIDNETRADAFLAAASIRVRSHTGRTWVDADGELDTGSPTIDSDDLEVAKSVVVQMAARVWLNPTGVVHETEGPFSARYAEDVAQGMYLTEADKALLDGYSTTVRPKLWTLPITRGDAVDTEFADTVYAPTMAPGAPIPYRAPE